MTSIDNVRAGRPEEEQDDLLLASKEIEKAITSTKLLRGAPTLAPTDLEGIDAVAVNVGPYDSDFDYDFQISANRRLRGHGVYGLIALGIISTTLILALYLATFFIPKMGSLLQLVSLFFK